MKNGNITIVNRELEKVERELSVNLIFLTVTLVMFSKMFVDLTMGFSLYLAIITPVLAFCLWKFYQVNKILTARKLKIINKYKGVSVT